MASKRLFERVAETQVWRSIFRHGPPDTPRNRSLTIVSNLFLHLHPVSMPRHALRYTFTWGMGGISFLLFFILTLTGVLLMFYYVPDVGRAYSDMKDLRFAVPFGIFLRNMHRWAAHAMVVTVIFHMMRVFYTGSYRPPREFNWGVGVVLLVLTLLLSLHRISAALGPISLLGDYGGYEHGSIDTVCRSCGPFSRVARSARR